MSNICLQKNSNCTNGEITLPASKSLSNRALIIQKLCLHPFHIHNISNASDTENLVKQLNSPDNLKNVGAAGTNMRFLISLLSITPGCFTLTGTDRMLKRPVMELVECLKTLGAEIKYNGEIGFPPLEIKGKKLQGGCVQINGDISSQFISSLLMIAPSLEQGLDIEILGHVVSKPYIDMTLGLLAYFGINHSISNRHIRIPKQSFMGKDYSVEPDWSAAAFWYGMVSNSTIGTSIFLKALSQNSLQGDKKAAKYFELLGVNSTELETGILIKKVSSPKPYLKFDLINEPDLFPALAFSAAALKIPARFTGLDTLNLKESQRIETVKVELGKTGAACISGSNFFEITGFIPHDEIITFESYDDHRIAMASAILTNEKGKVYINHPEVVSKSYPSFWDDIISVGLVFETK